MKISVIMPVLNEAEGIERTLLRLMDSGVEIIVVDGGSYDGTAEIATRYAKVVVSEPGRGRQMNAGGAEATGDILLFLHSDSRLPDKWREAVSSVMRDQEAACGAFSLSIDSNRICLKTISYFANTRSRLLGLPYGDQGLFMRRELFRETGGFKDIPIMEDLDIIRRLRRTGRIVILPENIITSSRRWEKEGVAYTTIRNWILVSLYLMGVPPEKLHRFYKSIR